jgi:hypothetical protein
VRSVGSVIVVVVKIGKMQVVVHQRSVVVLMRGHARKVKHGNRWARRYCRAMSGSGTQTNRNKRRLLRGRHRARSYRLKASSLRLDVDDHAARLLDTLPERPLYLLGDSLHIRPVLLRTHGTVHGDHDIPRFFLFDHHPPAVENSLLS